MIPKQAICLAPTMELAAQTAEVAHKMGQFMKDMTIALGIKGQHVQRNLALNNQIIIGTPGTVLDWSTKLNVVDLKKIKIFVLDEADVMIAQQGHQDFCTRIVRALPKDCQILLFSATYNNTVMEFATKIVKDPVIFRLRRQEESLNYIQQFYVVCDTDETKYNVVLDIYGLRTVGQAIVFCQRRQTASDLAVRLHSDGISSELLSGELDVNQRAAVIDRFRLGKSKMLVTTNVTARGMHTGYKQHLLWTSSNQA
jgi:ATP-dependent RNA helicase DDX19/DBP5